MNEEKPLSTGNPMLKGFFVSGKVLQVLKRPKDVREVLGVSIQASVG